MVPMLVWCIVFNATFNTISVISWWSVLLVEETGVPGEYHRPVASYLTNVLYHWKKNIIDYSFCTFSFGHCVVCSSSIYGFWLPLWYLQKIESISVNKSVTSLCQSASLVNNITGWRYITKVKVDRWLS
jgi:hypothetical protein